MVGGNLFWGRLPNWDARQAHIAADRRCVSLLGTSVVGGRTNTARFSAVRGTIRKKASSSLPGGKRRQRMGLARARASHVLPNQPDAGGGKRWVMFETLEEQIKETEGPELTTGARIVRYVILFIVSAIVFGGLYMGIRLLD